MRDVGSNQEVLAVLLEISASLRAISSALLTRGPISGCVESMNEPVSSPALVGPKPPNIDGVMHSVVDVWQAEHRRVLDARYLAQVRSRLDALLAHSGRANVAQVTREDVTAFLESLSEKGERGKGIGAKTYTNYLLMFSGFFAWAVRAEYLRSNPCAGMRAPRVVKRKRRALTADEVRLLLASAKPERAAFYRFLAVTGMRIGEVRALRRKHILETHTPPQVFLPGQITKTAKDRVVVLDDGTAAVLAAMLAGKEPDDHAFQVPRQKTLTRDMTKAGIPRLDAMGRTAAFHSFRRFLPTELAKQGVSAEVARAQLGHSSVQTTLEHYTDAGLQDQASAVSRLAAWLLVTIDSTTEKNVGKSLADGRGRADTEPVTPVQSHSHNETSAPGLLAAGVTTLASGPGQVSLSTGKPRASGPMGATGLEPVAPNALALRALELVSEILRLAKGADRAE